MKLLAKLSILLLVVSFTGCYTQLATRNPDYRSYEEWDEEDYVYDDSTDYYDELYDESDSSDYAYDYNEDPLIINNYYDSWGYPYYGRYDFYVYPYSRYSFAYDWYWYPGIWDPYYSPWYRPWFYDSYYFSGYYYDSYYYHYPYAGSGTKYRTNKYASIRNDGGGRGNTKRDRDSYSERTRKDGYHGTVGRNSSTGTKIPTAARSSGRVSSDGKSTVRSRTGKTSNTTRQRINSGSRSSSGKSYSNSSRSRSKVNNSGRSSRSSTTRSSSTYKRKSSSNNSGRSTYSSPRSSSSSSRSSGSSYRSSGSSSSQRSSGSSSSRSSSSSSSSRSSSSSSKSSSRR